MKLTDALKGVTRLGIDTPVFIYFTEANPQYVAICRNVFARLQNGDAVGYTSMISLTEALVHPLQTGDRILEAQYCALLLSTSHVVSLPMDATIARRAAELRAVHNLLVPDAVQVAAALESRCEAFLTNDRVFRRVPGISVVILDELAI